MSRCTACASNRMGCAVMLNSPHRVWRGHNNKTGWMPSPYLQGIRTSESSDCQASVDVSDRRRPDQGQPACPSRGCFAFTENVRLAFTRYGGVASRQSGEGYARCLGTATWRVRRCRHRRGKVYRIAFACLPQHRITISIWVTSFKAGLSLDDSSSGAAP